MTLLRCGLGKDGREGGREGGHGTDTHLTYTHTHTHTSIVIFSLSHTRILFFSYLYVYLPRWPGRAFVFVGDRRRGASL